MSKNAVRDHIRSASKVNDAVEDSLQTCLHNQNRDLLLQHIAKLTDKTRVTNLKALLFIWDSLVAEVDGRMKSFMPFEEGFDVYIAFSHHYMDASQDRDLKNQFKMLLLHPLYGLRVTIVKLNGRRWILLRPNDVDLGMFFSTCSEPREKELPFTKDHLHDVLRNVDTEWDKKVLCYLLSEIFKRKELELLGIDGDKICMYRDSVRKFLSDLPSVVAEAENDVEEVLRRRRTNLRTALTGKKRLFREKEHRWTAEQRDDRMIEIEELERKIGAIDEVDKTSKEWKGRVERMTKKLINDRRMKRRRIGSGRKRVITEEGERYVAKCIAEKATAHGRRHDAKLYIGKGRVKKKHFLGLINKYNLEHGLPAVKSATTVLSRGQPKRKNSIQARRQIGLALFCCKKSPKSVKEENILTHYCRALKKNVSRSLHSKVELNTVQYRTFDDKAYLAPGTSTGMQSTRAQRLYMSKEKETGFSHYDFPETMVNVTPGTFLYMQKDLADVEGVETVVQARNDVICQIKPKFFVGSGNGVWASHLMDNRHQEPSLHEVERGNIPQSTHSACLKLKDTLSHFIMQSCEEDALMVSRGDEYIDYEIKKLNFLSQYVTESIQALGVVGSGSDGNLLGGAGETVSNIERDGQCLLKLCKQLLVLLEQRPSGRQFWTKMEEEILPLCKNLMMYAKEIPVPPSQPYVVDITDAGPGVGISNHEVGFRVAQEIQLCNYDYYIRVHNAPNDSSSNEVERIQSHVGDAVCDGRPLDWELHKKFEGLSEEEIMELSVAEIEEMEYDRMKKNAFEVCEEVSNRIDGATTTEGFYEFLCLHGY